MFHDRTKHIELDRHFIMEKIDSKELILPYNKMQDQVTDIFIKGPSSSDLKKNICKLDMFVAGWTWVFLWNRIVYKKEIMI